MKKILVIDEDRLYHQIFKILFNDQYLVDSVTALEDSFNCFASERYDLIFIDTESNGCCNKEEIAELIENLRSCQSGIIVCCSTYPAKVINHTILDTGADYVVPKPASADELKRLINCFVYKSDEEFLSVNAKAV